MATILSVLDLHWPSCGFHFGCLHVERAVRGRMVREATQSRLRGTLVHQNTVDDLPAQHQRHSTGSPTKKKILAGEAVNAGGAAVATVSPAYLSTAERLGPCSFY